MIGDRIHIFSDFDGTITDTDSLVFLTRELGGGPELLEDVGKRLRSNSVSLRDAISEEMASIRATFDEARELLLRRIARDPDFPAFAAWCRSHGLPLTVLSSGFHEIIDLFVSRSEFPDVDVIGNRVFAKQGGWECTFRDDSDYGTDKAAAIEEARGRGFHTIFIGDGFSDRASAEAADTVFAKRYLAEYCGTKAIPYTGFDTFADVLRIIEKWRTGGWNYCK